MGTSTMFLPISRAIPYLRMLIVCCVLVLAASEKHKFHRDKVYSITIQTPEEMKNLNDIMNSYKGQVNEWSTRTLDGGGLFVVDVHATAPVAANFQQLLDQHNLTFKIMIDDLQRLIDLESQSNQISGLKLPWAGRKNNRNNKIRRRQVASASSPDGSIVGKYATYDEIVAWLKGVEASFPNIVTLQSFGKTFEGRDLYVLKISLPGPYISRPGFWVDFGIHAREWISPSSGVYMIYQILSAYTNGTGSDLSLLQSVDWYIAPLLNPDGYSFSITDNRLWRKNRSVFNTSYSYYYNMPCHGADLNRNFDFHWGQVDSSSDPCEETYRGQSAMCENETQAITAFLTKHNDTLRGFMTIHSYGQLLMNRWAYAILSHTSEYNETLKVMQEAAQAIKNTSGESYRTGSSPEVLYAFTGGSGDWVRYNLGVKHTYDVELRDTGNFGFILPANYVIPVGNEIWQGIKVVASHIVQDFPPQHNQTTTNLTSTPVLPTTTTTTPYIPPTSTAPKTTSYRPPYCDRDAAPWCWNYDPSYCYTISNWCCNRCYYGYRDTDIPDCVFGDHYSWCSTVYCYTPYLKSMCCLSCWNT